MDDLVIVKRDKAMCDSLMMAGKFGKRHKNILQAIDNLVAENSAAKKMFTQAQYVDQRGKQQRKYFMDRDGFSLIAMGLTGKDALDWKIKYIGAFNQMDHVLTELQSSEWQALRTQSKAARRIETDSVQEFIEYAKAQGSKNASRYYSNLTKLVNKAAGITSRNLATGTQLNTVMFLERMIGDALRQGMSRGMDYKDIYDLCKSKVLTIKELALLDIAA